MYENIGVLNEWWWSDTNFVIAAETNIEFEICKWFSVRSGFEFFGNKNEQSGPIIVCPGPGPYYYYENTNYKYLHIPFDLKFTFLSKRKINLFLTMGFINGFYWGKYHVEGIWSDGTITKGDRKVSFQYNRLLLNASAGISFPLEQNTKVVLEPNFWGSGFDSYSDYFIGGKIGIEYIFRKK